jgi:predicted amidohydrolase
MVVTHTVRVAAVQATPVILDADASVDKAIALARDAASEGAQLVVLPECFVALYPMSRLTRSDWDPRQTRLFERMWRNAIDVRGPLAKRLAEACRELDIHLAIGVNEREDERPGSLYNTMLLFGPRGLLMRHRKLMPTHHERLFHAIGAGDDLTVVPTRVGRLGGLTCWENFMPLARYAVYRQGPQIWLAPTMDDSDVWPALMQTVAFESGAWVVSVCGYSRREDHPAEVETRPVDGDEEITRGGTMIVGPDGTVVAGPLYGGEGVLFADCDLSAGLRAKYGFDSVGHYSREDALLRFIGSPPEPAQVESQRQGIGMP